jgi:hypothetical protein
LLHHFVLILGWQGSRREILRNALLFQTTTTAAAVGISPNPAHAARGAAELDLEYYLRDLLGGNKPEGNVEASRPPAKRPPRTLGEPLSQLLLNDNFTAKAVPVAVLAKMVQSRSTSEKSFDRIVEEVQSRSQETRERVSRSFYARSPWDTANVRDEYFFDVSAYALWRTAADLLPNYADRDAFVRRVGKVLYREMIQSGILPAQSTKKGGGIVATVASVQEVLQVFVDNNFCQSYRLGSEAPTSTTRGNKKKKEDQAEPVVVVDELDDEVLLSWWVGRLSYQYPGARHAGSGAADYRGEISFCP